jgi:phosphohistidine swiveling domain-containing protein
MTAAVLDWEAAFTAGPARCGGKGYNLARLFRYGFRVPSGGVVPAETYAGVISEPTIADQVASLATVTAEDASNAGVGEQLDALRQSIERSRLPGAVREAVHEFLTRHHLDATPLAVRSSAVGEDGAAASFAGIHESVLNVQGVEAVEAAVLRCFASLWTPTAVAYRRRLGYPDQTTRCAVVVLAMVHAPGRSEPATAGVAFSCDPRTGRRNVVVINASHGMGDKVVQGSVNPDQYVVATQRGAYRAETVLAGAAHVPPVLSDAQQLELARLAWRIHWALGNGQDPQDIEWAHDGRAFWVVQARPVTRLPRYTFEGCRHMPAYWSTANIKDAVPGVMSVAAWSMIVEAIDGVLNAGPAAAGIALLPGLETVRRYEGRSYFDLTSMQWMMYDGLGVRPAEIVKTIGGHQPEIPVSGDPFAGADGRRRQRRTLRLLRALFGLPARMRSAGEQHLAAMRRHAARDFASLSDGELADSLACFEREALDLNPLIGLANTYAGPWQMMAEGLLRPVAGGETTAILNRLLAGGGNVTSAEQGYRLHALADVARRDAVASAWLESRAPASDWTTLPADSPFREQLALFLDEFGHRAVYEADIINPRWIDDPSFILDQIRVHLHAARREPPRNAAERTRQEGEAAMARRTIWRRPLIRWAVSRLQRAIALREYAKSVLASVVWPSRRAYLEVGRRLVSRGHLDAPEQVFHLAKIDVICLLRREWDGRGARALASDRKRQRDEWLAQPTPPDVIVEEGGTTVPVSPPVSAGGDAWSGIGVSSGRATGPVRIVRHPHDGMHLHQGDVLVAPSTDPGWTPLFLRASAIVMESGGYLSHGAIVAREFGLPAVVNVPGIIDCLVDDEIVTVDGDAARVSRSSHVPS